MWLISLHLFLFTPVFGLLGLQTPPKLPTSEPIAASPTLSYTESLSISRQPTPVFISVSSTTSQPQNRIQRTAALPTPVFTSLTNDDLSISRPFLQDLTDVTLLPSTDTIFVPTEFSSTANLSASTTAPTSPSPLAKPECIGSVKIDNECPHFNVPPMGCRCDDLCKTFGDCCSDANHAHNMSIPNFDCVSNFVMNERKDNEAVEDDLHYYWMIASCPNSESINGLAELCEAQSLSSPPISDNRTGLVYRNKYCAQCHGVHEREQVSWPSQWYCNNSLLETSNSSEGPVDLQAFLAACNASVFLEHQWNDDICRPFPIRKCDKRVIYKCQPAPEASKASKDHCDIAEFCNTKSGKVGEDIISPSVNENVYCALCRRPDLDKGYLQCDDDKNTMIKFRPINTFTMLLDVTGSGVEVLSKSDIQVTSTSEQSCADGQVFDVYDKRCRESFCPLGYSYNGTSCLPTNCTLLALNDSEYDIINNHRVLWVAVEQNVTIQGYTSEGNPLVCTNFTSNFTTTVNETNTRILYGYPEAFSILSYLGLSVDVVAAAILLFTYAAFAEMRTFYGKLFMNFVLVLLLGDLTFLLGTAVYTVSLEDVACQVVGILLHYLFLARFVWMSLLSLNVARHFYHAMKFIVSEERESWHYLILYMAAGWLSPLLVLVVTVPVNYTIPGSVGYGVDGLCWMNQTLAIIVSFIAPLTICVLCTTGAFVYVCIILVKWHSANVKVDLKQRASSRNCRVLFAIFGITGVTWVFGFLAMIDSALSWAWYLFIILNATQAMYLTLAYVCTAKVLRLYRSALTKVRCGRGRQLDNQLHIAGPPKQMELINKPNMVNNTTKSLLVSTRTSTAKHLQHTNC